MRFVERCFAEAVQNARGGDPDQMTTIEAVADPAKWIQLTGEAINAAYPLTDPPARALAERSLSLPERVEVLDWKGGEYVTFGHDAEPLTELAWFAEQYLVRVLGVEPPDERTLRVV